MGSLDLGLDRLRATEVNRIAREKASEQRVSSLADYNALLEKIAMNVNSEFSSIVHKMAAFGSSDDWNTFLDEVRVDMKVVYELANTTDSFIVSLQEKNRRFYEETRGAVQEYKDRLQEFRGILANALEGHSVSENFFDARDMVFQGTYIHGNALKITPFTEVNFDREQDIKDVDLTLFPAEGAESSVWNLTNLEHDVKFNYKFGSKDLLKQDTTYFGVNTITKTTPAISYGKRKYGGVIAFLDITFSAPRWVNRILIKPIGKYGMNVLDVLALETGGNRIHYGGPIPLHSVKEMHISGEEPFKAFKFVQADTSSDIIELIGFRAVNTTKLRIVLFQSNPSVAVFPRRDNTSISDEIVFNVYKDSRFSENGLSDTTKAMLYGRMNLIDLFYIALFRSRGTRHAVSNITNMLFPSKVPIPDGTYYSYDVGAYSVTPQIVLAPGLSDANFLSHPTASTGYDVQDGVTKVELASKFDQPHVSTVKFSIVDGENRISIPILPNGAEYFAEKVSTSMLRGKITQIGGFFIKGGLMFSTSWPANGVPQMFVNDIPFNGRISKASSTVWIIEPDREFSPEDRYLARYLVEKRDVVQCWRARSAEAALDSELENYVFASREAAEEFLYEDVIVPENIVPDGKGGMPAPAAKAPSQFMQPDLKIDSIIDLFEAQGFTGAQLKNYLKGQGFDVSDILDSHGYELVDGEYTKKLNTKRFVEIIRGGMGRPRFEGTMKKFGFDSGLVEEFIDNNMPAENSWIELNLTYRSLIDDHEQRLTLFLPTNYAGRDTNHAIVAAHGVKQWSDPANQERWRAYGQGYAKEGYIVAYPEYRRADPDLGYTDLASVIYYLRNTPEYKIGVVGRVGTIGGSAGNVTCIQLHQDPGYNADLSAHVSLYGALPDPDGENEIYDAANLAAQQADILMQIGENDMVILDRNRKYKSLLAVENPGLKVVLVVYPDQGHGFFFQNNDQARIAQGNQLDFWNEKLKEGDSLLPPDFGRGTGFPYVSFCSLEEFNFWFAAKNFFDLRSLRLSRPEVVGMHTDVDPFSERRTRHTPGYHSPDYHIPPPENMEYDVYVPRSGKVKEFDAGR